MLWTLNPQPTHTCRLQSGLRPAGITTTPRPSGSICHRRTSGLMRRPQLIAKWREGVRTEKQEEGGELQVGCGAELTLLPPKAERNSSDEKRR